MLQSYIASGGRRALRRVLDRFALSLPDGAQGEQRLGSHAKVLRALNRYGLLSETGLHRYLNVLFSYRRMREFGATIDDEALGCADVRLYHRCRLAFYRGKVAVTSDEVCQLYGRTRGHSCLHRLVVDLAAEHFVRTGDAAGLAKLLRDIEPADLAAIENPTMTGCAKLLRRAGEGQLAEATLKSYLASADDERKLYFLEAIRGHATSNERAEPWRAVLDRLERAYSAPSAADALEFRRLVGDRLRLIPEGSRDTMNVRFDEAERGRLIGLIAGRLRDGEPLSLVRLGDGESYAFPPPNGTPFDARVLERDAAFRERYWWGEEVASADRAALKRAIAAALDSADVIGVPSVYRVIRDRGPARSQFGATSMQRGLAVVLSNLDRWTARPDTVFTEERCHHVLFGRDRLKELARLARRLVVVGCWEPKELDIFKGAETHHILVPGQMRLRDVAQHGAGRKPLFDLHEDVTAAVEEKSSPGTLVLVGAGVIGKIFVAKARARGAVALDVGSILDYLAGYKSRSVVDNA